MSQPHGLNGVANTTRQPTGFRKSEFVHVHELGEGNYAVWNRYFACPVLLNREALDFLDSLDGSQVSPDMEDVITTFLRYRLVFDGDKDPYRTIFIGKMDTYLEASRGRAKKFRDDEHREYGSICFMNDACNLNCPYCYHTKFKKDMPRWANQRALDKSRDAKSVLTRKILDRHFQRLRENGHSTTFFTFSGGEILLEWQIVRGIMEYVEDRYSDFDVEYSMLSNMTLMNEEIARVMAKHKCSVGVSIDGYRELNETTRNYHNGRGSYDKIMEGIAVFNKHNKEKPIKSFQGTIDSPDFDAKKFLGNIAELGFKSARLAPNLLGDIPESRARHYANTMADLFVDGSSREETFTDTVFQGLAAAWQKPDRLFQMHCEGLTCGTKDSLVVNFASMTMSRMCMIVPGGFVPIQAVDGDIFHRALWDKVTAYSTNRINTIKENCLDCEIVSTCQGNCVLAGIDAHNRMNPTACTYQRQLTKRVMKHYLVEPHAPVPPVQEDLVQIQV